ncbi:MAG TPA: hypothetical protein VN577_23655 [Terriglobales bacterium]|nr:hypothetical protein [Terriglobales bacterium]
MPCPFFIPLERFDDAGWAHPLRLPLGAGFRGSCCAPGAEGYQPTDEELKSGCNLGYARTCPRLPHDRDADAVRFSVQRERDGQISICYVSELDYLPAEHGMLHYQVAERRWVQPARNVRIMPLAECFLNSYLDRKGKNHG